MAKIKQRLAWIAGNALHQGLAPLSQFLVSFFVIFFASKQTWGEVVEYLLIMNLAVMFINWGQHTYLLREFSQHSQKIAAIWQTSIQSRKLLLWPILLYFTLEYYNEKELLLYLILWLTGVFIFRSYDPLHVYTRRFRIPILIDIFSLVLMVGWLWIWRQEITVLTLLQLYVFQAWIKAIGYSLFYQKTVWKKQKGSFQISFFRAAFPFFIPAMIGFVQSRIDLYGVAYYLTEKELGEYQIFFKILMLFVLASRIGISPFLKNIYRMPTAALQRLSRFSLALAILLIAPALFLISCLLPVVYDIRFSWKIYLAAYLMLVPFFGYVIQTHQLIKARQEKQMVFAFLGAACFNLCSNCFLIPNYGALGAIVSTALVQWVLWLVFSRMLQR